MSNLIERAAIAVFALCVIYAFSTCRRPESIAPSEEPPILSGRDLVTNHFADFSGRERLLSGPSPGDASEREVSTSRVDERIERDGTRRFLLRVVAERHPGGEFLDSTLMALPDLRPVREHYSAVQIGQEKWFDFNGSEIRQKNVIVDSTATFDRSYPVPVYGLNQLEPIVRSLPFRPGYAAIVPLYSEVDDALEMDTIRVTNKRAERFWDVRFADASIVAMFLVDASTRRVVGCEIVSRRTKRQTHKVFFPVTDPLPHSEAPFSAR